MTMYYTPHDEAYLAARNQTRVTEANALLDRKTEPVVAYDEIPDISEAERIWKLLVDSANS